VKSFFKENKVAILLLVGAAALIFVGLFRSQTSAVLSKAVRICMECVGLG